MPGPTKPTAENFGLGPILQTCLPEVPWDAPHTRRLPGIGPLDMADWLRVDEAFAPQMALRDHLAEAMPDSILACLERARPAAAELLDTVLAQVAAKPGYLVEKQTARRPDGVIVPLADPIPTLARLVAEDLCILEKSGDEHVLSAATLAFPSGWTLAQKLGRPLMRIHRPVPHYDGDIGRRVQRMFDALMPGRGLVRTNALNVFRTDLYRPNDENRTFGAAADVPRPYIRSERQCLIRLPATGAVVFSIHTRIVHRSALGAGQAEALAQNPIPDEFR